MSERRRREIAARASASAVPCALAVALSIALLPRLGAAQGAPVGAARVPSAAELLARVERTYAECRSYRDRGVAVRQGPGRLRCRFSTAFAAPGRFRFEWGEVDREHDRGTALLWSDGTTAKRWDRGDRAPEDDRPLALLLSRSDDESGGSSMVVPPLLPCSDGSISPITRLTPAGEPVLDPIDGRDAWQVGLAADDARWTVWIDASRFLLLRADREGTVAPRLRTWSIRYEPELDPAVSDAELALSPPWQERRVSDLDWALRLMPLGGIALGLTAIYYGRRAQLLRRPIVVPNRHYLLGGLVLVAAHPFGQLLGYWSSADGLDEWGGSESTSIAMLVAFAAVAVVTHLRAWGGYAVVGTSEDLVRRALRAALQALGVELVRNEQELQTKDRAHRFEVKGSSSFVLLLAKGRGTAPILKRAVPLLEACFDSEAIRFNALAAWWRVVRGVTITLISFTAAIWMWRSAG